MSEGRISEICEDQDIKVLVGCYEGNIYLSLDNGIEIICNDSFKDGGVVLIIDTDSIVIS